jgi:hypothetical protein
MIARFGLTTAAVVFSGIVSSFAQAQEDDNKPTELTLRGRVVCLNASGTPSAAEEDCDLANGFALRTSDDTLYRFSRSDSRVEILADMRVRSQELEIAAWLRKGELEIVKLYSLHNGELFDVYYRCDVCNITAHTPGPCWCCRQDFELRETPRP